ncbi:hypothetical protein JCM9140_3114 [Halalkalibacter wakoensis JCM 9140]|uniref:Replicative helicase inhibitor G39P N-terminal domain-containing protein n=1 Tax=Halalkalibacter wakoensis JCM 9140 TaxID=1236970 RepID=W4Q6L5_9BACI|nr:hypothetical protein [Halalkalibacter wakoensis]GAE27004.1 hypothetical protein JCM9140_3114 [Halalkalibacter wakoensis JCM 9140]
MTSAEATEILYTIHEVYPSYKLTERKLKALIPALLPLDFKGVMDKLNHHIVSSPYPPTIAEIAEYPKKENEVLLQLARFEREAAENPPTNEQKKRFESSLKALLEKSDMS